MGGLSEDDTAHLVARLRSNSRALLSLVGNVLDLSRLDADKLAPHVEPVSPIELVREVVDSMDAEARRKGIEVRVEFGMLSSLVLDTDRLRLRQILVNLIANALKFTPTGWVEISARATDDGNHLAIDVTDTGIGIAQQHVASLFEPFSQLTASASSGGSGLGLALSRRLAEHLGGALTLLQSEPGKGSTFRLTLDGRRAQRTVSTSGVVDGTRARISPKPTLSGFRILLAEDNPDLQMAIGRALRLEGASMSHAWNGREAVEMAQAGTFDVVIMDVRMPLMDGLDATRTLRASGFRLPIVALSADSTSEGRAASMAAGCSAYFTKPFDPTDLITSIRFLRHHGSERRSTPAT
jgi:CheY-like chemotaxis protein/anti-sigma regulatory factor (Ser/Thr protein kinase)